MKAFTKLLKAQPKCSYLQLNLLERERECLLLILSLNAYDRQLGIVQGLAKPNLRTGDLVWISHMGS